MLIRLTTMTGDVEVEVVEVVYIRQCRHCDLQFETKEQDKFYCKPSHSVRASEHRRIIRESRLVKPALRFIN